MDQRVAAPRTPRFHSRIELAHRERLAGHARKRVRLAERAQRNVLRSIGIEAAKRRKRGHDLFDAGSEIDFAFAASRTPVRVTRPHGLHPDPSPPSSACRERLRRREEVSQAFDGL